MEEFKKQIEQVISGELNDVASKNLISPHVIDEFLKELGYNRIDFDSNGWDWDFWITYQKDDDKFTLSGSGFYNQGLFFSKYEE